MEEKCAHSRINKAVLRRSRQVNMEGPLMVPKQFGNGSRPCVQTYGARWRTNFGRKS